MKLFSKALMWATPIWVLLIMENYFLDIKFIEWMNLPGILLVIALNPKWESVHDVDMYLYLILNIVIYFFLIYLALFVWGKLKKYLVSMQNVIDNGLEATLKVAKKTERGWRRREDRAGQ